MVNTAPLWEAYKQHGDQQARTALIEAHIGLVHLTRQRVIPRVPERVDAEDLHSEGLIAVVRAVDKFEPARGVKFTCFCISMIRGAMLEYLRAEDWAPRSVRDKQKTLAQAADSLVHALGREPEDAETAAALGLDLEALGALRAQAQVWSVVSLEAIVHLADEDQELDPLTISQQLADPAPGPEAAVLAAVEAALLRRMIGWLPEREREVVEGYFDEGRTLKALAARIDRSESRAHQLYSQAIGRLRGFLGVSVPERALVRPRRTAKETAMETEARNGAAGARGQGSGGRGGAASPRSDRREATPSLTPDPSPLAPAPALTPSLSPLTPDPEWDGWTAAEDETLRELWGRREPTEIGRKLGRTAAAIKERAGELQLGGAPRFGDIPPVDPRSTWWTPEEDARLREQWGQASPKAIGQAMGRNRSSVSRRAKALGLAQTSVLPINPRRSWTAEDDEQLRTLHGTVPRREIALRLQRTVGSISCRVGVLALNEERAIVPGSHFTPPPSEKPAPPAAPIASRPSLMDAELLAMAEVYRLLAGLDERARARVVRWVADRWEAVIP